jgi:hemoglobin
MSEAKVFGGPKTYSAALGGHPNMIRHHVGRALSEAYIPPSDI